MDESRRREADNQKVIDGQARALELAVRGAPLGEILEALVRTIETRSDSRLLGSILVMSDDGLHLRHGAAPSLPTPYNDAIDGIAIGDGVGSCGTAAHTRQTVVVRDIATDPLWANFKDLALQHGLRACWSTPIFSRAGNVMGTFALYHHEPAVPSERDLEVVELLGHTAALVIERERDDKARAAAERQLRTHLEHQLERLGALLKDAPAAFAVLRGAENTFELANAAYVKLVGGRDVLNRALLDVLPEIKGQGFEKLLHDVRSTRVPYVAHGHRVTLATDEIYVDFVYQPILEADGSVERVLVVAYEVSELVRALRSAQALATEMTEQSLDVQRVVTTLQAENKQLAARVAELSKRS